MCNWALRGSFHVGVFVVAGIMAATVASGAGGAVNHANGGQSSVAGWISGLKTFINDDNVALFHNDLMDSQREAYGTSSEKQELVRFIFDIWEQNEASLPDLNWQNARKDEFRVSIAAIMTLGIRDGWIDYDQEEINQYFRERVTAENPHVSTMAIIHLAIGGNDEDAVLFRKLGISEAKSVARQSIKALGMLCRPAGEEALKQLESEMLDADRQALVAETLQRYYGDGPVLRCYR